MSIAVASLLRIMMGLGGLDYDGLSKQDWAIRNYDRYLCSDVHINGDCGLCFEAIEDKYYKLECGHTYHYQCDVEILSWFRQCESENQEITCPMCRSIVNY